MHHPEQGPTTSGVVVAHGMLSSKESDKHRMICEAAASAGTLALRFDFRGRGDSDGDPSILTVSCPWLIIHGAADPVVRVADADLLAGAAPNASLMVHPNAGHRFDQSEERDWLIQRVADFIASRL